MREEVCWGWVIRDLGAASYEQGEELEVLEQGDMSTL